MDADAPGYDRRNFTPDDYRLLARIVDEWIDVNANAGADVLAHARDLRQWFVHVLGRWSD